MMMMMKNPVILVTCVLLFSALAVLASESFGPDDCCFKFVTKRLPKDKVVNYKYTDGRCGKKAVIFKMKKGAEICATPSDHWVTSIINFIDAKEANVSPTEPTHVSAPQHRAH